MQSKNEHVPHARQPFRICAVMSHCFHDSRRLKRSPGETWVGGGATASI